MEPPDSSVLSIIIYLLISLFSVSIFAFLETSITAMRLFKLKEFSKSTTKYKDLFSVLELHPNRILTAILVANNLCNVITATFSGQLVERAVEYFHLPEKISVIIGIFVTTLSILIFELIPKNIAKVHGEEFFGYTLGITNIIYKVFYPAVKIIANIAQYVVNWIGSVKHSDNNTSPDLAEAISTEKEIQFLIDYINEKGLMECHKSEMLKGIFELGTKEIKKIMVPGSKIISLDVNSSKKEVLDYFSKYQFTRLPVYDKNPDNIIGILYQKDFFKLLSKEEDKPIREIIRTFIYFPETAKLLVVLKELREQRIHMAFVLNEFGSIVGMVTLEDVLEEIVGEISDEYEDVNEKIIPLKPAGWLIDGSIELEELSKLIKIDFDTDSVTLAGFLVEQFQRVPKNGDFISYQNYVFKIQQASNKRILQVIVYSVDEPIDTPEIDIK